MSGASRTSRSGAETGPDCRLETAGDGRASLTGPLTFETVTRLFRAMEKAAPDRPPLEQIDLAGVTGIDSAGLALLLEWQSRSRADGQRLSLCNAPDGLLRLARLCEATDLLNISGREGGQAGAQ